MKKILLFIFGFITLLSCKKDKHVNHTVGKINVVNAIADGGAVKVNPSGKTISWGSANTPSVAYGGNAFYYASLGLTDFVAVRSADTSNTLFSAGKNIQAKMYTMYLFGTLTAVDTMFREEVDYPVIRTDLERPPSVDSIVNLRFVNLSIGSPALKIRLSTGSLNEVDNLPYKGISLWKAYPARMVTTAYSFQIRNTTTDALITTYNFSATSANRFKNVALVLRGVFGTTTGTAPFGVTAVNYY